MTAVIKTERLTKSYGAHRGIVELDLEVAEGEIFGFLGPNGAGKTTTMRVLLDLIRPTCGRAEVFGIETTADPVAIHRRVGYLPGEFDLYDRLTGAETIAYFGNLRGGVDRAYVATAGRGARPRSEPAVQGVLEGQQAEGRADRRAPAPAGPAHPRRADGRASTRSSSRPSSGSSARRTTTAGRSSCRRHIIDEVDRTCERVAIIREGRLVQVDRIEAIRELAFHHVELTFRAPVAPSVFDGLPGVSDVEADGRHHHDAGQRPDRCGDHGRGPARDRRRRQPRAEPRGRLPRPVRRAPRAGRRRRSE